MKATFTDQSLTINANIYSTLTVSRTVLSALHVLFHLILSATHLGRQRLAHRDSAWAIRNRKGQAGVLRHGVIEFSIHQQFWALKFFSLPHCSVAHDHLFLLAHSTHDIGHMYLLWLMFLRFIQGVFPDRYHSGCFPFLTFHSFYLLSTHIRSTLSCSFLLFFILVLKLFNMFKFCLFNKCLKVCIAFVSSTEPASL